MPRKKLPSGIYKREETYYCCFTCNGTRVRKKLSTDLEVSKVMLRKLRLRHEAGEVDNDYPFTDLVERYFTRVGPTIAQSSVVRYRDGLRAVFRLMRPRLVSDVTPDAVHEYQHARLAEGVSAATIEQGEVGTIKNILRWGAKQRIIASNPLVYMERLPFDMVEVRPFSPEDAELILDALSDSWRPIVQVTFAAGLRRAELADLRVEDVDLDERMISIPKRLAKRPASVRKIPILDCVYPVFQEACIGREPGELVFLSLHGVNIYHSLYARFANAAKRAGVKWQEINSSGDIVWKRNFHSIRHSFATWLRERGAAREVVEDLIGHKRSSVTDRYLTFDAGALRNAMNCHPWGPASPPEGIVPFLSQHSHKDFESAVRRKVEAS